MRSGTDIAFLGGMIKYILDNKLYHEEYVANYTNAPFIVNKKFQFENGVFSGYDYDKRKYDKREAIKRRDEQRDLDRERKAYKS